VHTEYSLLDGSAKINELASKTYEMGMNALAITDHGNMYGAVHFYKACKAAGIKPIMGCEVYVAKSSRLDKTASSADYYHIVLLAENNAGYQNLMQLVSCGFTEGFYYKPRVDIELLKKYKEGLICLSGCLGGPIAQQILHVSYERALNEAKIYKDIFGEKNFFIELQDHGLSEQKSTNKDLIRIAKELGLGMVATNDIHYTNQSDAKAHEVLLCIQTNKTMMDDDRIDFGSDQFYLKSPKEMQDTFYDLPEALENTVLIANRCNVEITFNEYKLPKYSCPDGLNASDYLKKITYEGLQQRYFEQADFEIVRERADFELETICSMGFNDYFLVVWDFICYAKQNGIAVGPGRGTSAASIVAYALGITSIDPLASNLLFERFLNPERISMPDIDIDFCFERRQEVIDYVTKKYGQDHVAQIITFGTMGAKAAIRDTGRGLGMLYTDVDRVAKMIPFYIGITLDKALEREPSLRKEYNENEKARELIEMARRLEGLPRHASTHAAGVVISDAPLTEYVPLQTNDGVVTTQFPMGDLEELGLLKMDFLGLRTLTVIQHTINEAKRRHGVTIDLAKMDMENPMVFETIASGKTLGMFQLESRGMTSFMKELKPTSLADLTAGISLFRPGPMEFIPRYVRNKNDAAQVSYAHPLLEPILKETYGVIVYQEQVMQIVRSLAGYSLGRADLIRRAMSKKTESVMKQEKQYFVHGIKGEVAGCVENGIPQNIAEKIWEEMADFAKYAFNKAHAAAYATIGYQTAWLKMHYPAEFMAALLTSVMDSLSSVTTYIAECKRMGLDVMPPDINQSFGQFTVNSDGNITFGMNAIKNLGRPTVAALVLDREKNGAFGSLSDFIFRLEEGEINKRSLESLIKAGALTSLGGKRSQYMFVHETLLLASNNTRRQSIKGQVSIFDMEIGGSQKAQSDILPDLPEFPIEHILAGEKEVMGIYVSGHPLNAFEEQMKSFVNAHSYEFSDEENIELADGQRVTTGGIITKKNITYTRRSAAAMCFLTIEDVYGYLEVVVFPELFAAHATALNEGAAIIAEGRVSLREDQAATLIAEKIRFLNNSATQTLWVKIPEHSQESPESILKVLSAHGGTSPVVIYQEATKARLNVKNTHWVNPDSIELMNALRSQLGSENVILK